MGAQVYACLMWRMRKRQANFYIEALGGEIQFLATDGDAPGIREGDEG